MSKTTSSTMSENSKPTETPIVETGVDLSNSGRGIWLVKVPKYIAQKWEKAPSNMDVAKLRITKQNGKKLVSLSLTPSLLAIDPEEKIPSEHILDVSKVTKQSLAVFSHTDGDECNAQNENLSQNSKSTMPKDEKLCMDGRIVQKLECRPPIADKCYMQLKLDAIRKASKPQRVAKCLDKVVQTFKPVSNHANNIEYANRKKKEGKKMRDDKNIVMDTLFKAFEKHQYYNIKDLVKVTNQPVSHLKEVLKDICDYNVRNPHRNMWELKKEYRHYQTEPEKNEVKK